MFTFAVVYKSVIQRCGETKRFSPVLITLSKESFELDFLEKLRIVAKRNVVS